MTSHLFSWFPFQNFTLTSFAVSEEQEEGEIVEEDEDTSGPSVDKCSDLKAATGMEEYEERRVFYHPSSGYYYDPVRVSQV